MEEEGIRGGEKKTEKELKDQCSFHIYIQCTYMKMSQ
jgi:hypothetical protein